MTGGIESLGRIRLQGIVLLAVAFSVGALAGAAGERVRASRVGPPPPEFMRPPGRFPGFFDRLDLTETQREQIDQIFRESRPLTDSLMNAWLPRVRVVMDSVQQRVRNILTPEQREQLDEMEVFRRGRGRFGPGGRRPGLPGTGRGMR